MNGLRPGEASCSLCQRGPKCSFWSEDKRAKFQEQERHDCSFFRSISGKALELRLRRAGAAEVAQESLF